MYEALSSPRTIKLGAICCALLFIVWTFSAYKPSDYYASFQTAAPSNEEVEEAIFYHSDEQVSALIEGQENVFSTILNTVDETSTTLQSVEPVTVTIEKEVLHTVTQTAEAQIITVTTEKVQSTSPSTSSWSSKDGLIKHYSFRRQSTESTPSDTVLIAAISRDEASWGRNPAEKQRSIYSHLDFITNNTLQPSQISVAILTSSPIEFERYAQILTPDLALGSRQRWRNATYYDYDFKRVYLVLHTAETREPKAIASGSSSATTDASRGARHNVPQHERRANLAKLRNYIQNVALEHESHILWLDSDVYRFSSKTMITDMLNKTRTTSEAEVGILTSRCRRGEPWLADQWMAQNPNFTLPDEPRASDSSTLKAHKEDLRGKENGNYEIIAHKTQQMGHYDLNAWAGRRQAPNNVQQEKLWKDVGSWTPQGFEGEAHILDGLITGTTNDDIRRLDSVGGTILMIRADLIRMGLNFPVGYVVGMTYEHGEGFDGIETEGLCLMSRLMSRDGNSTCFTMGGDWSVWHTIF